MKEAQAQIRDDVTLHTLSALQKVLSHIPSLGREIREPCLIPRLTRFLGLLVLGLLVVVLIHLLLLSSKGKV